MNSVPDEHANVTDIGEATSALVYGAEFKTILTNGEWLFPQEG